MPASHLSLDPYQLQDNGGKYGEKQMQRSPQCGVEKEEEKEQKDMDEYGTGAGRMWILITGLLGPVGVLMLDSAFPAPII